MAKSAADDVLDLGGRIFIGGFFVALGLASLITTIGTGVTMDSVGLIAGVANALAVVVWANWAYAGNKIWQPMLLLWLVAMAGLAGYGLGVVGGTPGKFLAAHLIVPVIAALTALGFQSVRVFLAVKGGASIDTFVTTSEDEVVEKPPVAFVTEGGVTTIGPETRQGVQGAAKWVGLASFLCFLLAAGNIVMGVWLFLKTGGGLALFPIGLIAVVLGMVSKTLAADLSFLGETRGYDAYHLANSQASVKMLLHVGGLAAAVVVILAVVAVFAR